MSTHYKFSTTRGGHAPGHLRDALLDTLDWAYQEDWFERLAEDPDVLIFRNPSKQERWERMSGREKALWLCGQLWNCTDILPRLVASEFDLRRNTYAVLARHLRDQIKSLPLDHVSQAHTVIAP
jgi:hypothetical protein